MQIDNVSKSLLKLALHLESTQPGLVSEIWIDKTTLSQLRTEVANNFSEKNEYEFCKQSINECKNERRKEYLSQMLEAIIYLSSLKNDSLEAFYLQTFHSTISRPKPEEIDSLTQKLHTLEKKCGKSITEVKKQKTIKSNNIEKEFNKRLDATYRKLSPLLPFNVEEANFEYEETTNKPWGAFNSHTAPYTSKLTINIDFELTGYDLNHFTYHEAYGGHHTELSMKDKLLINEGRGEHGFVLTYSPQTFISEGIAEMAWNKFGMNDQASPELKLLDQYSKLRGLVGTLITFWHFEDKLDSATITDKSKKLGLLDKDIEELIGFATDELYGRYVPVYHASAKFIQERFDNSTSQQSFLEDIYTKPTTASMLQ